ncbi:MAG TPA: cupredoxin domain-containing protein [Ilumatobacteraceae bacterium]|jgi:plastocyanin|nr:cupredoxin domain-containing protein [Ilumatobacteraceae bacterium]
MPFTRPAVALLVFGSWLFVSCGSDDTADSAPSSAERTIEITATEYEFNGDPGVIGPGDTIEFDVENAGEVDHSLEVLSSSGTSLGRTERIAPGASDSVTVTFADAGVYRLICDVDDHLSRGQTASISVG